MMGMWFMGAAIGNLVAGLVARYLPAVESVEAATANGVGLFGAVAILAMVVGVAFLASARPIRTLSAGVT